ncbi:MAG: sulfotransferase [Candidatus Heimdallarchaeaceae archaeon]
MSSKRGLPPIIIIGMHRSGTSMLSRILEELGLFVGYEKEDNNEAIFFQKLNLEILESAYSNWEQPGFLYEKIIEKSFQEKWIKELITRLISEESKSFLGADLWERYTSPFKMKEPWGWKDPRNTYTLPIWLEIFPEAKIIHIYRHGIDVASSLRIRHEKRKENVRRKKVKRVLGSPIRLVRYVVNNKKFPTKESLRLFYYKSLKASRDSNLKDAFNLWEEYVEESLKHVNNLKDRSISLKYEDILEEPLKYIKNLVSFCNLTASEKEIKAIAKTIDKSRSFAYKKDPELVEFELKVKDSLNKYSY